MWSESTIRSILHNEKYKRDAIFQKSFTVDFLKEKRRLMKVKFNNIIRE